ncbi:MAG: TauD/TfdA family dioxygenase [Pseudomonadota bacterium]
MNSDIRYQPLTPALGVEVLGLELRRIDESQFKQLRHLWHQYKAVFIRDQDIDLDDLLDFSRRFGTLMKLPYITPFEGYPEIIRVLKEADEINMGTFGGDWHSDFSFLEVPPMASILYAEEVPAVGGDTLWIDMTLALKALPKSLLGKLQGRRAIHTGAPYGVKNAPESETQFKGSIEIARNNPEADRKTLHPVICRHPETGESALFVNPTYTTGIEGYSDDEATLILRQVFAHCSKPEYGCRFHWQTGSIALWDNRNTLHYAVNDYDGHRRCLYRTTIASTTPPAE